jgi:hypothetical protein
MYVYFFNLFPVAASELPTSTTASLISVDFTSNFHLYATYISSAYKAGILFVVLQGSIALFPLWILKINNYNNVSLID